MPIVSTSNFALPRFRLMELVAASPAYRAIVGASTSAEAVRTIHSPWMDDSTDPDSGAMVHPRPRCSIWMEGWERHELAPRSWGGTEGKLLLNFEFLPDPSAGSGETADINRQHEIFEEQVGAILEDIELASAQGKASAADNLFTDPRSTHLHVTGFSLMNGPGRCNPKEHGGAVFYGVLLEAYFDKG